MFQAYGIIVLSMSLLQIYHTPHSKNLQYRFRSIICLSIAAFLALSIFDRPKISNCAGVSTDDSVHKNGTTSASKPTLPVF